MAKRSEAILQKAIIESLNYSQIGFFWKIRNGSTWDPTIKRFRANTATPGIPDICGYLKSGRSVFVECKYVEKIESRKKIISAIKITREQKDFLYRAYKSGCFAGVAFTLEDAIAIAKNDPEIHPRHPRTYQFLPDDELAVIVSKYAEEKKAFTEKNKDPLAKILWASKPQSQ